TRITESRIGTAAPIERELRIGVIAEREIVAEIFEMPPVGWAVAENFTEAKTRRKNSASSPRPHVLEDERQPHHGNVADVQHGGTRDHDVLRDHLDLFRLEMIIGNRVVAAGYASILDVKRSLFPARSVGDKRGSTAVKDPLLSGLHRRADVRHAAATRFDVVLQLAV